VLAPQDRLLVYLRDSWGMKLGDAGQYLIFDGIELVGRFRAKIDRHEISIWDSEVNDRANEILKGFLSKLGRGIQKEQEKRLSEWEITDFFERSNLFVKD